MPSAHPGTVGIVTADQRGHLAALIGEDGEAKPVLALASSGLAHGSSEPDGVRRGRAGGPGDDYGARWLL